MGTTLVLLGAEDAEHLGSWGCVTSVPVFLTSAAPFSSKVSILVDIPACPLSRSPCEQFRLRRVSGVGYGLLVAQASCRWHKQEEKAPRCLPNEPSSSRRVYGGAIRERGA